MGTPTHINIFPDETADKYRWQFCYLHGNAEFEYNPETGIAPDIFMADEPMPEQEGNYLVWIDGQPAVAVIAMHYNTLSGRIALISDTEALRHALDTKSWQ